MKAAPLPSASSQSTQPRLATLVSSQQPTNPTRSYSPPPTPISSPLLSSPAFERSRLSRLSLPSLKRPLLFSSVQMTQAENPSPPLITWSLTGKRGRKSPRPRPDHPEPESQERDIARFLLTLSSPSPAPDEAEAVADGDDWRSDGAGERIRRIRRRRRSRTRATTKARVHECSLCPKRFRTGRALGGHMKSHWERDLHGRVVKKKTKKLSSLLGLGLGLEFGLQLDLPSPSPPNPKPMAFSSEAREGEEEYGGDSLAADPSSLLLPF